MFKLLKSYISIYQRNRHRKFVIYSLTNLAASGSALGVDFKLIYDKILDIIVNYDEAKDFNTKESKVELPLIEKLVDIIAKK